MNIANKLTISRVVLIPFFIAFVMAEYILGLFSGVPESIVTFFANYGKWIALVIFAVASITDFLDGYIARKYDMVSNFGKFLDPLADKLLVCSALICLLKLNQISVWVVLIIILRDFTINAFRLIAVERGIVIAASWSGKIKTTLQMIMVIVLIMNLDFAWYKYVGYGFQIVVVFLTIYSLISCFVKNKGVLKND